MKEYGKMKNQPGKIWKRRKWKKLMKNIEETMNKEILDKIEDVS